MRMHTGAEQNKRRARSMLASWPNTRTWQDIIGWRTGGLSLNSIFQMYLSLKRLSYFKTVLNTVFFRFNAAK